VVALLACGVLALSGCGTGSLATSDTSAPRTAASSSAVPTVAGPTVIVTVPDLLLPSAAPAATAESAAPTPDVPSAAGSTTEPPAAETDTVEPTAAEEEPAVEPTTGANDAPQPAPAPTAEPPPPPGEGLNVSLANCDGCAVLATHRDVTGGLSAALVGTPTGRAILLSVGGDGQVSGVIGVPYGAAFAAPSGGVLACAQGRCVVEGRQNDGRAILSAFELTGTGAWRDVSGDDAFPSATERAAAIDLDGELGIAVQDQAAGAPVWMLYTWGGDRYSVLGCAADGPAPTSAAAVSPSQCLS
jgi:hypothetical protein